MNDYYGKFQFSYHPPSKNISSFPVDELPETSVDMAISAEADLPQMLEFFKQFLLANGYIIDTNQKLVLSKKEG